MKVEEGSGWEKIHSVCLLGLNAQMLMVFGDLYILGWDLSRIYF